MTNEMVPAPKPQVAVTERGVMIRSVDELYRFGEMVQRSGLAPKGFQRAEQVCVAVAHGMELGLSPMQSLQGLVVINGKVSMYGDTARALVQAHPHCIWITDNLADLSTTTVWGDDVTAVVSIKRKGHRAAVTRKFSVAQAKAAGLWGKEGPWRQYPDRMLYYRALGFALRDAFPDVLRGIKTAEELRDYPANGPVSGTTLPPKDLDEVTQLLDRGTITGLDDEPGMLPADSMPPHASATTTEQEESDGEG